MQAFRLPCSSVLECLTYVLNMGVFFPMLLDDAQTCSVCGKEVIPSEGKFVCSIPLCAPSSNVCNAIELLMSPKMATLSQQQ